MTEPVNVASPYLPPLEEVLRRISDFPMYRTLPSADRASLPVAADVTERVLVPADLPGSAAGDRRAHRRPRRTAEAGAASSRVKLAIMQPYLFPYIGYFQLLASVDEFVVYDNIQYTKKGWINRNRFLQNGEDVMFSLPLAKASDYLDVREREIADAYKPAALLARFAGAYGKAPFYAQTRPLLEDVLGNPERNLFAFLHDALLRIAAHLGLQTVIRVSSTVPIDHALAGQDKVLALCEALDATTYINPIGGVELYSRQDFAARGIELHFLQPLPLEYVQFGRPFVPWLSIIDVLMFNELDTVRAWLDSHYELT